jgi:hypothetical protein
MNPFPEHILRPLERECCHGVVPLFDMQEFFAWPFISQAVLLSIAEGAHIKLPRKLNSIQ